MVGCGGVCEAVESAQPVVCGSRLRSLRKFTLLLGLFQWKSCGCSLVLPPVTLSREVLKVELGLLWGRSKVLWLL